MLKHAFYKTKLFVERANEFDAWDDIDDLKELLDQNPFHGDVIPGSSGLRKVRMRLSRQGKGSRGGARVIYYQVSTEGFILFVYLYAKNDMADLANDELSALETVREKYVAAIRKDRQNAAKHSKGASGRASGHKGKRSQRDPG